MNQPHAGVVLAAGGSRRLGQPKQLLSIGGQRLIQRSVQLLQATGAHPLLVMIGAEPDKMRAELSALPVIILEHPGWSSGLAGSLQAAARACQHWAVSHVLLLGTDQPRLTSAHLLALLSAADPAHDVLSGYAGIAGIPAALRLATLRQAQQLKADAGLRPLLREREDVRIIPCAALADDLDTPEDVARARRLGWIDRPSTGKMRPHAAIADGD